MKYLYILIVLQFSYSLSSQSMQDFNWVMGYQRDLGTPEVEGMLINFDGKRTIESTDIGIESMAFNNASISSKDGDLLFYTNGCTIHDSSYNIMDNGEDINYNEWYDTFCDGHANGLTNTMILPDPGNKHGYYVLHGPFRYLEEPFDVKVVNSMYTYIDMQENNGLGSVIEKNIIYLPNDTIATGLFSAIYQDNGKDWWFIKSDYKNDIKYVFGIDSDGIYLEHAIAIGDYVDGTVSGGGQAKFSPDGTKYAYFTSNSGLSLYDFDRSTGLLSNYRNIPMEFPFLSSSGMEFSPNGRFIYISYAIELIQVDLWENNLDDGVIQIDTFDGFSDPLPVTFKLAQMGPDCKIYISSGGTVPYLHVINNQDPSALV